MLSKKADVSCSVLVVSCDRYRDLWVPFFALFWRNWTDCPFSVYLGANFLHFDDARVETLACGEDRSWSANLKYFLQRIHSKYVLLLLEDFFLDRQVSSKCVDENLNNLAELGGTVLRLFPQPGPDEKLDGFSGVGRIHSQAKFRVSAQPAIWNREDLLGLLQDGETAWDFELNGTLRSRHLAGFYACDEPVVSYRHVVERGKWFWSAARLYRGQDLGCDFTARPGMSAVAAVKKSLHRRWKHFLEALSDCKHGRRVAFLTNFIPPYRRPLLLALTEEFESLRVFVSTPMENNRSWEPDWTGLDVHVQRTLTVRGLWRAFGMERLAVHLPLDTISQLQTFRPDVVISAELGFRTVGAVLYRKLHPRSKLVVWADIAESTERGRGTARKILRRVLRDNIDLFFVNGRSGARYLQSIGVPTERIRQIPSAVDVAHFSKAPVDRFGSTAHRLLYVGQLIERKGLIEFLAVLNHWAEVHSEREVEWDIVGDGPLLPQLVGTHTASNLTLRLRGSAAYEHMPSVYAAAGILILPTWADAWGMTVNEGMAACLPVLGSVYSQAVEEMVEDGVNGWTFHPDQRDEMVSSLTRCLQASEAALNRMRSNARETAGRFTPERVAHMMARAIDPWAIASTGRSKRVSAMLQPELRD